jgi:hypothetical protein
MPDIEQWIAYSMVVMCSLRVIEPKIKGVEVYVHTIGWGSSLSIGLGASVSTLLRELHEIAAAM